MVKAHVSDACLLFYMLEKEKNVVIKFINDLEVLRVQHLRFLNSIFQYYELKSYYVYI